MIASYLAFMDHSITEQLTGCPTAWHTTAIVLAEGGEVSELASRIARGIYPKEPRLRKWSAGRVAGKMRYRKAFARELAQHLPSAKVLLLATSATEDVILHARDQLFQQLRINNIVSELTRPTGTTVLRVGPFFNCTTNKEHFFELPLNRAIMAVWVAHFVARMHNNLRLQLQAMTPDPVIVDWFFCHDKFAGDSANSRTMMSFYHALASGSISDGNIRSGFFVDSDTVDADLLADNVAGFFNITRGEVESPELKSILSSGCVYYESGESMPR
jgi:hypothetical protein